MDSSSKGTQTISPVFEELKPSKKPDALAEQLLKNATELSEALITWRGILQTAKGWNKDQKKEIATAFFAKGSLITGSARKTWDAKSKDLFHEIAIEHSIPKPKKVPAHIAHFVRKSNDLYDQMAKEVLMKGSLFWTRPALREFTDWQTKGAKAKDTKKPDTAHKGKTVTRVHCEHTNPVGLLSKELFLEFIVKKDGKDIKPGDVANWLFTNVLTTAISSDEKHEMDAAFKGTDLSKGNPHWKSKPFKRYEETGMRIFRLDRNNNCFYFVDPDETSRTTIKKWYQEDPYYGELLKAFKKAA